MTIVITMVIMNNYNLSIKDAVENQDVIEEEKLQMLDFII